MRTNEVKHEICEITKWEQKIKREDLKYETKNYTYDFQQYERIRSFGDNNYTVKINIEEAEMNQSNLFKNMVEFNNKSRTRTIEGKDKKRDTYGSAYSLYEGCKLILNAFKSRIFLIKATKGEGLKILTPKQMLERLLIAFAQVKAGDASNNLLNEIRQVIYSLHRAKEITKKVYNNIMNSVNV